MYICYSNRIRKITCLTKDPKHITTIATELDELIIFLWKNNLWKSTNVYLDFVEFYDHGNVRALVRFAIQFGSFFR